MATIVEPRLFSGQLCIYDVSLSSEKYSLPQMMSRRNKIPTTPTAHTWRMALPKLEFVSKQKIVFFFPPRDLWHKTKPSKSCQKYRAESLMLEPSRI